MSTSVGSAAYNELTTLLREAELLASCANVLQWDEQTYMPTGGGEYRASQLSLLAGLTHERRTAPRIGELLTTLEQSAAAEDPDSEVVVNVREARRSYDRATKLPRRLVEELTRTTSLAQQAWGTAKKDSDFAMFCPWLERMIALKREEAAVVGYGSGVPYDALLDDFEPGATTASVNAVFDSLRPELVRLVQAIVGASVQPSQSLLEQHYPIGAQRVFAEAASKAIGFDFERGRLDESRHPFCSGIGPGDCRLTTRYQDHFFPSAFFGVLHESGHGIYDQGLLPEHVGLPMGQAVSLGIHESQSRLWENFVGRSRPFWEYFFPAARQAFPQALGGASLEDFYSAINIVRPSFIRVEADEATYNLHIMLRFELEQKLIDGSLSPADVPTAWNEKMKSDFGLDVPDDAHGCLQDIHWSAGLLGYFPTYALGNMYAAQLYEAAEEQLGPLADQFARGEFKPLKEWLNQQVHRHGKRYPAPRLVEVVTARPLAAEPLTRHLWRKYSTIYQLPEPGPA